MVEPVPYPHEGFLTATKTPDEGFGFGFKGLRFFQNKRDRYIWLWAQGVTIFQD
jgi:hypothetical protein